MSHYYGRNPVACTRCRRLKVKCKADSHNLPCHKCIRDGADCVYISVGEEAGDTSRNYERSDVYHALSNPDPRFAAAGPHGSCTNCTNHRRVCDGHRPCTQCFTAGMMCDPMPAQAQAHYPQSSTYPYQPSSHPYPNTSTYPSTNAYPNTHSSSSYPSSNQYPTAHSSSSHASYSSGYTTGHTQQSYTSSSASYPYPSSHSTAYYPTAAYNSGGY